jgi:uncharacterized protein (TIGR02217 family)
MPAFHEILFPVDISFGSSGGAKFNTAVTQVQSSYELRKNIWPYPKAEYNISYGIRDQSHIDVVTAFFYCRYGRAYGFRFKDWNDYKITDQLIALGDGVATDFQIIKTYTHGGKTFQRKLTKIAWNTLAGISVGGDVVTQSPDINGQYWSVDSNTGILTFANAPDLGDEIVIGTGEFHVPVRFDTDHLDLTHEFWNVQSWPNIPLVEVRNWTEVFA